MDANIIGVVRLAEYDPSPPVVTPAYIGPSAWTFALKGGAIKELAALKQHLHQDEGIKVSISGTSGMSRCINWTRYCLKDIYVLEKNRKHCFWDDIFKHPKFDDKFYARFETPPEDAVPFQDFDFAAEAQKRKELQNRVVGQFEIISSCHA